ncbi:MAG: hypothetical protein ABFD49_02035 [Armatimonadota bacterium]|nr:hypothetical protein [bacterium]
MALKALFVIAITTSRMIFPGISAISPDVQGKVSDTDPAVRSLTMQLLSNDTAAKPQASVTLPTGLKLGETAVMQMSAVTPSTAAKGSDKVTLKTYWGSSEAVEPGQPSVKESDNVEPRSQQDYKTIAVWPGQSKKGKAGQISENASAVGIYNLTADYTGSTFVTLSSEQDFLAPIRLIGLDKNVDLDKPIKVEWNAVPNALAYMVTAYGGNADETITWTAGSEAGAALNVDNTAFAREELDKLIEQKALLSATTTSATIPAEAFKGSTGVMLLVTAIGADKVQDGDAIRTEVIVRSTACAPLYSAGRPKKQAAQGK